MPNLSEVLGLYAVHQFSSLILKWRSAYKATEAV
jgi:hypothetical protein